MSTFQTFAPAKINLYLHITGKRDNGYHLLDSLVAFTNIGDALYLESAPAFVLTIDGPMAGPLASEPADNNLVAKAAKSLALALGKSLNFKLTLTKKLPIASGIGGGSSDAAAALRLVAAFWGLAPNAPVLYEIAASLGADIPCCIDATTCYFRDIGNIVEPGPALPHTDIVLVNPNEALPTPAVYKARAGNFSAAARLEKTPQNAAELALALQKRGNDLTEPACRLIPTIRVVLAAIEQTSACLLARMSGSGATCFGLYPDRLTARQAASQILTQHPDWWVVPGYVPCKNTPPMG